MRLGFAVKVLGEGGLPAHDARRWQSGPHLRTSIEALHGVLDYLGRNEIGMYRMTASLAPYATHPDLPRFHRQVEESPSRSPRSASGRASSTCGSRPTPASTSSSTPRTRPCARARSATSSCRRACSTRWASGPRRWSSCTSAARRAATTRAWTASWRGFERLSERARARLVIENDDRTYALGHVLALHGRTGLRVVWDILHHHCNDPDGIPDREALEAALATWPAGVTPKIHFSSPKTAMEERKKRVGRRVERSWVLPQLRAHADVIDPIAFEHFLRETAAGHDFDVMLEAKAKDLALLRLRDQLAGRGLQTARA